MFQRKLQSVLYVDDDPDICEVVQAALSLTAGLEVHTAGSGGEAIDLAYELRPDLILMDVMMPGLDGPSTLISMRDRPLVADIPIVFLTAKVLPAETARFTELGAIGVIGKPFDPMKIGDDICALWHRQSPTREPPRMRPYATEVQCRVDKLALRYLERTRADIVRLKEAIDHARRGNRAAFREIAIIGHSIGGAGVMFGFPSVGAVGVAIERLAEAVNGSHDSRRSILEPRALRRLAARSEQLEDEVGLATRNGPAAGAIFELHG